MPEVGRVQDSQAHPVFSVRLARNLWAHIEDLPNPKGGASGGLVIVLVM